MVHTLYWLVMIPAMGWYWHRTYWHRTYWKWVPCSYRGGPPTNHRVISWLPTLTSHLAQRFGLCKQGVAHSQQ